MSGDEVGTDPDSTTARLLLRLGTSMLEAGADARSTVTRMEHLARAWGWSGLTVTPLGRTLLASWQRPGGDPVTLTASTTTVNQYDLYRLDEYATSSGLADVALVAAELDRTSGGSPWQRSWIPVLGGMVLAASITLQTGGGFIAALLSMVCLMVMNRAGWLLSRLGIPWAFVTGIQAAVAVLEGMAALDSGAATVAASSVIVATCLVLILPIPQLVQATEDAMEGFEANAAVRLTGITIQTGMILAGAALVLSQLRVTAALFFSQLRVTASGSPLATTRPSLAFPFAILACVVGAMGNAVFMNGGRRLLLPSALAGGVAGLVSYLMQHQAGQTAMNATFVAAAVLGLLAYLAAPRLNVSRTSLCLVGIAGALLPGLDVHDAIAEFLRHDTGGDQYMLKATVTTLLIGPALVLGSWLGRRLSPGGR